MRDDIERDLLQCNGALLAGQINPQLVDILRERFGSIERAFVVNWIPEQGEDIYFVAVPPAVIATVEIPRGSPSDEGPTLKEVSLADYHCCASKEVRRKLAVIQRLWK